MKRTTRRSPDTLARLDTYRRTATGIVARWRRTDGEYRWLEGNLLALIGRDGAVTGFRGTHRDITERKHQQERIGRLTRFLQMQSGINAACRSHSPTEMRFCVRPAGSP